MSIETIVVDSEYKDQINLSEIFINFPDKVNVKFLSRNELINFVEKYKDSFIKSKKILFLTKNTGDRVVACPASKGHICCGYQIISPLSGCPLDCAYCILQTYYSRTPFITYDVDKDKLLKDIDYTLINSSNIRWGTGEFSDSMSLEPMLGFHKDIIKIFLKHKNKFLEIKTKDKIPFDLLIPDRRVLIGTSINIENIIEKEETNTISLLERFKQADEAVKRGYSVCFHFDPIIELDGSIEKYIELIKRIESDYDPHFIGYISLGTLRFVPKLSNIIRYRFPKSRLLEHRFIRGDDNKWRYPIEDRIRIYQEIINNAGEEIRKKIYLCMESAEVVQEVFGKVYNLKDKLDKCVLELIR